MFEKFKAATAKARLQEEKIYEQVQEEINVGKKRDGLWAKAIAKSNGSEEKALSIYIALRVQSIKDENELKEEEIKRIKLSNDINSLSVLDAKNNEKIKSAKEFLHKRGYRFKRVLGQWKIYEPLGGEVKINSFKELDDYIFKRNSVSKKEF